MTTTLDTLDLINAQLDAWLPDIMTPPGKLHEAMRYSMFAGGKRLRPRLALASCEALGGDPREALAPAAALEMIHTYSLIHDDLPAMDDDNLRRGQPTCHVAFGEDMAILAGDALLTLAFEVVACHASQPQHVAPLTRILASRAGYAGMVGGQVADIASTGNTDGGLDQLKFIHKRKTAALISAAFECGAVCANASESNQSRYRALGESVGLAFQIVDDILDITGDTATLGKTAGKDDRDSKLTYPAVVGLDRARRMADALGAEVLDSIASEGPNADTLRQLITDCIERDR